MRPPDETLPQAGPEPARANTVAEVLRPLVPETVLRGPLLFVAAHPDDAPLGASWLLRASPGAHVVHVTDGAPRDASLRAASTPPREAYAHLRQKEAFAALSLAGLSRERLLFLGAVEQEAALELVTLTECLVALLKALRPSLLVVHPYEGGHPDHDAAAFISHAAVALMARAGRTPPVLLEMTSFHLGGRATPVLGEFLPTPEGLAERTVSLTESERSAKRRMLACYGTQARELRSVPVARERYRLAPPYDFTRPPHEGLLQYEAAGRRMTGARWRELARRALEELKLPETPWH